MAGGVTVSNDVSGITIRNGVIRGFYFPTFSQSLTFTYYGSWTMEDLILDYPITNFDPGLKFGTNTRISNVSGLSFAISVGCPSVVSLTIAYAFSSLNAGTCTYGFNASTLPLP
jgi:hypothetical protein